MPCARKKQSANSRNHAIRHMFLWNYLDTLPPCLSDSLRSKEGICVLQAQEEPRGGSPTRAKMSSNCPIIILVCALRNFILSRPCSTNPLRDPFDPKPCFSQAAWYAADSSRIVIGNDARNARPQLGPLRPRYVHGCWASGVSVMRVNRLTLPAIIFERICNNQVY